LRSKARGEEQKKIPAGQVGIFFGRKRASPEGVGGAPFDVLS